MALTPFDRQRLEDRVSPLTARTDRVGEAARALAPQAGFGSVSGAGMSGLGATAGRVPEWMTLEQRDMPGAIRQNGNSFSGGRATLADAQGLGDIGRPGGTLSFVGVSPEEQRQRSALAESINLTADSMRAGRLQASNRASDVATGQALQQSVDERQGLATGRDIAAQDAQAAAAQRQLDRESNERLAQTRGEATLGAAQLSADARRDAAAQRNVESTFEKELGRKEAQSLSARNTSAADISRSFRNLGTSLNRLDEIGNRGDGTGFLQNVQATAGQLWPGGFDETNAREEMMAVAVTPLMEAVQMLQGLGQVSNIEFSTVGAEAPSFSDPPEAFNAKVRNLRERLVADMNDYAERRGKDLVAQGFTREEATAMLADELPWELIGDQ